MIHNQTIDKQVQHRSIRKFKDQTLNKEQLQTLYEVARRTSTSMFMQQFSILHLTDPKKRAGVRVLCGKPSQQTYVGANGDLFIFLVDLYRNQQIRRQLGKDDGRLHTTDIFLQGMEDTLLAVQNVVNAAESMGLGCVTLGTINDHPKKLMEVLDLPPLTFPVLGLQVGVPDQKPQLKPRLPQKFISFDNEYPRDFKVSELKDYDKVVRTYYDLRDTSRRIDSFTHQITGSKLNAAHIDRDQIPEVLHAQGLCLDWK